MRYLLCPQATAIKASLKRSKAGSKGLQFGRGRGSSGAALVAHVERCMLCGRDRGDAPWPP